MRTLALVISLFFLTSCASESGSVYSSSEARRINTVQTGKIIMLRPVKIDKNVSPYGALGGAAIGGIAGSTIGRNSGSVLAALGGAVIGGLAGAGIEKGVTGNKSALEIMVTLDSTGQTISIVQEVGNDEKNLRVNDAVIVSTGRDGSARVYRSGQL